MKELILKVEKWAEDRGFYDPEDGASYYSQVLKLYEEFGELCGSIAKGRDVKDDIGDNVVVLINLARLAGFSLSDAINEDIIPRRPFNDCMVHIILMAHKDYSNICFSPHVNQEFFITALGRLESISNEFDSTLKECLGMAYNEIKDRKGKMIKGVYVKESDL